jgi:hypothetical protein
MAGAWSRLAIARPTTRPGIGPSGAVLNKLKDDRRSGVGNYSKWAVVRDGKPRPANTVRIRAASDGKTIAIVRVPERRS